MMKFQVGSRVRITKSDHAKFVGRVGEVVDVATSRVTDEDLYTLRLDGTDYFLPVQFSEDALEDEGDEGYPYCIDADEKEDVLYLSLIKHPDTTDETVGAQAFARIKSPGVLGWTQACSFAMKKLYNKLGGKF